MPGTNLDLARLLAPIDTSRFLGANWGQAPLFVSRQQPGQYTGLLSGRDVDAILCTYPLERKDVKLLPNHAAPAQAPGPLPPANDPIGTAGAYLQGKTVALNNIQSRWGPIARLCRNLEKALRQRAFASAFLTPEGAQSSVPHFDVDDVFILQLEGSKCWRVFAPALPAPLPGYAFPIDPQHLAPPLLEVEVQPGDLLYLPRGFIHDARTSASPSLHLTVGIHVCSWGDLLSEALTQVIRQDPALRQSVPLALLWGEAPSEVAQTQFQNLLQSFAQAADLEKASAQRVEMFLDVLQPLPDGHFSQLPLADRIGLDTVLRKRDGTICRTIQGNDWAGIQFPGNTIRGPKAIRPALDFIAATDQFPARSLPGLSDEARLALARRLLKVGLLRIAGCNGHEENQTCKGTASWGVEALRHNPCDERATGRTKSFLVNSCHTTDSE